MYIDGWLPTSIGFQEWSSLSPYLHCQKPTDDEQSLLPNIILTSDVTWDPSLYDNINEVIDRFQNPL
jgi:hypothetical protein